MRNGIRNGLLAAVLMVTPASASSQCGMDMGGGSGHGHGRMEGTHEEHESKARADVDQKAKKNARKLLNDPRGQDALLEAILEDAEFTRILVATLLQEPKWRALMSEGLSAEPKDTAGASKADGITVSPERAAKATYRCPMHAAVISDEPGRCPKCGMELERVEEGTDK